MEQAIQFEIGPYVGPKYFEKYQQRLFFGREREVAELVSLVTAYQEMVIYAASASGKTSLLRAGLIPALERAGHEVFYPPARVEGAEATSQDGKTPCNHYVFNALTYWIEDGEDPAIPLGDFLRNKSHFSDSLRILFFDQFEEVFQNRNREHEREEFFRQVHDALVKDPVLRCVFVMRQEAIAELNRYASILPEELRVRFHLEQLRRSAALEAVTKPLETWQEMHGQGPGAFADGLASSIIDQKDMMKADGFVEPLDLQIYCQSIWHEWQKDRTDQIEEKHVKEAGGVQKARQTFFDEQIAKVAEANRRVSVGRLNRWFVENLVTPGGTRHFAYRDDEKGETAGLTNKVVEELERRRLVSAERRLNATYYELVHDGFIDHVQQLGLKARRQRLIRMVVGVGAIIGVILVSLLVNTIWNSPLLAPYYFDQASAHATQQSYQDAVDDYGRAISRRSAWAEAYYNRALVYFDRSMPGDDQLALNDLSAAIEHKAGYAEALYLRGTIYLEQGEYKSAEVDFNTVIALGDKFVAEAYLGLGSVSALSGDYQTALAWFEEAFALDPSLFGAYKTLGDAYYSNQRPLAALKCYEIYLDLAGDSADEKAETFMENLQQEVDNLRPEENGEPLPGLESGVCASENE